MNHESIIDLYLHMFLIFHFQSGDLFLVIQHRVAQQNDILWTPSCCMNRTHTVIYILDIFINTKWLFWICIEVNVNSSDNMVVTTWLAYHIKILKYFKKSSSCTLSAWNNSRQDNMWAGDVMFAWCDYYLTIISGGGDDGGRLTGAEAAKPMTRVWVCVSTFVTVNPLDSLEETMQHFQLLATKSEILSQTVMFSYL